MLLFKVSCVNFEFTSESSNLRKLLDVKFSFFKQIELQPIENVYPGLKQECNVQALECDIDEIESRYDDLCRAKSLVTKYRETDGELDEEMRKFNSDITKTLRTFRSAISTLDAEKVEHCLEVYGDALDGNDDEEKFARHWRNMLEKKVSEKFLTYANCSSDSNRSLTSLKPIRLFIVILQLNSRPTLQTRCQK